MKSDCRGLPVAVRGVDCKRQRHIFRPEGHILYQVSLVTCGEGVYIDEKGNKTKLKHGSVFMFRAYVPHEYYGVDENFSTYWINVDGSAIEDLFDYINVDTSCVFDVEDEYEYSRIELVFDEIHRAYWEARSNENLKLNNGIAAELDYNQYRESEMAASSAAYSLIEIVAVILNRRKYGAHKEKAAELVPVLEMIQMRYMENIGVTDMADHIGVSVNKIASMFKKSYGITPSRFLVNTRLNFAEMFLRKMDHKTVREISEMVGFSNSGYFIRVFKSRFGITPEVYREMYSKL